MISHLNFHIQSRKATASHFRAIGKAIKISTKLIHIHTPRDPETNTLLSSVRNFAHSAGFLAFVARGLSLETLFFSSSAGTISSACEHRDNSRVWKHCASSSRLRNSIFLAYTRRSFFFLSYERVQGLSSL